MVKLRLLLRQLYFAIANLGCGVIPLTLWISCVIGMHALETPQEVTTNKGSKENGKKLISSPQLFSIFWILLINYS